MKLIIPMAGKGTRLRPHTHVTPKPLLPVAGTSIIERIVQTFDRTLEAKIEEIAFILGDFGAEVKTNLTALCTKYDAKATFYTQDVAEGTAHAIYCAADSLEGPIVVVFADTLFDTADKVQLDNSDAIIWLKEVEDPRRFGVAVHEGENIVSFVEKPQEPISNQAIIGVYYFKEGEVLRENIKFILDNNLRGAGNEYHITDAMDRMLKAGKQFKSATVCEWLDCGTIPAWVETSGEVITKKPTKAENATLNNVEIIDPVYIGEGAEISNSKIGPNVTVDAGAKIIDSKISNSIVLTNASIKYSTLEQSTIGFNASVENMSGEIHIGDDAKVNGIS